jgi:hypothetical protein
MEFSLTLVAEAGKRASKALIVLLSLGCVGAVAGGVGGKGADCNVVREATSEALLVSSFASTDMMCLNPSGFFA